MPAPSHPIEATVVKLNRRRLGSGERMVRIRGWAVAHVAMLTLLFAAVGQGRSQPEDRSRDALLWTDPGDISARNLFWGSGGERHQPRPPAHFLEEDMH